MAAAAEDPFTETRKQATERRLSALEIHIRDLEDRLNGLNSLMFHRLEKLEHHA